MLSLKQLSPSSVVAFSFWRYISGALFAKRNSWIRACYWDCLKHLFTLMYGAARRWNLQGDWLQQEHCRASHRQGWGDYQDPAEELWCQHPDWPADWAHEDHCPLGSPMPLKQQQQLCRRLWMEEIHTSEALEDLKLMEVKVSGIMLPHRIHKAVRTSRLGQIPSLCLGAWWVAG